MNPPTQTNQDGLPTIQEALQELRKHHKQGQFSQITNALRWRDTLSAKLALSEEEIQRATLKPQMSTKSLAAFICLQIDRWAKTAGDCAQGMHKTLQDPVCRSILDSDISKCDQHTQTSMEEELIERQPNLNENIQRASQTLERLERLAGACKLILAGRAKEAPASLMPATAGNSIKRGAQP
jgi:hypothetical protein